MSSSILTDLSREDKKIIARLCGDIPNTAEPFHRLSEELEIQEEELFKKINDWKEKGIIRKFGAILDHNLAGYKTNAMVVWKVPKDKVIEVAGVASSFSQISHCYERKVAEDWPYNLFMVVHGYTKAECERVIGEISSKTCIKDYEVLYSTREFKKSSMSYFSDQICEKTE